MKPRVGIYLSKRAAARLTAAAKRRGTTKSALVEAALNRFLESEDTQDAVMLTERLTDLSSQIGQLDRDLGIVSEIVALHARFHLAVAPELSAARQDSACKRGSARFDEFAAQVERRLQQGTSLMQETIDRLEITRPNVPGCSPGQGSPAPEASAAYEADFSTQSQAGKMQEDTAAVREDGSTANFPIRSRRPLH